MEAMKKSLLLDLASSSPQCVCELLSSTLGCVAVCICSHLSVVFLRCRNITILLLMNTGECLEDATAHSRPASQSFHVYVLLNRGVKFLGQSVSLC